MVPNPVQLAELAIERFCFGPCFAVRSRHAKFFRLVREVSWEDPRSARRFKLELSVVPWCRGGFHSRKTSERSYVEPLQVDRGRFPGLGSGSFGRRRGSSAPHIFRCPVVSRMHAEWQRQPASQPDVGFNSKLGHVTPHPVSQIVQRILQPELRLISKVTLCSRQIRPAVAI